jgi:hypothetical protein
MTPFAILPSRELTLPDAKFALVLPDTPERPPVSASSQENSRKTDKGRSIMRGKRRRETLFIRAPLCLSEKSEIIYPGKKDTAAYDLSKIRRNHGERGPTDEM